MQVQHAFDIKGVVGTKTPACRSPVKPSAAQADTGRDPDDWTSRWQPGRTGRTAGYAAFSSTHTWTKGANRSALAGQASSPSLGGTATSAAEKPLFPALSAVDAKLGMC